MSWRLPPRSRRWRWCLPELASRGATPAWRASWASEGKRSIGPISQSSLAALKGPQPGSCEQPWCERLRPCLQFAVELADRAGQCCGSGRAGRGRSAPGLSARGGRAGGRAGRARPPGRARRAARAGVGSSSCRCQRSRCWQRRRSATRSSRWSTSSFSSRSVSSPARGPSSCGSCSAARATASASIESDLPRVRPRRRCGAVNRGGTRTSRSPAASSACSSPRVTCRQSSTAHSRSSPSARAQTTTPPSTGTAPLTPAPAELVDRDRRQRVLVYVHPDHDHSTRLLPLGATGERTDLNRGSSHAPIRSRSTVSGRRRRHNAGKSAHRRHSGIESAAANPNLSNSTPDDTHPTMTLSSGMSHEPGRRPGRRCY